MEKFTKHFVFLATTIVFTMTAFMTGLNCARGDITNALVWGLAAIIIAISGYFVFVNASRKP